MDRVVFWVDQMESRKALLSLINSMPLSKEKQVLPFGKHTKNYGKSPFLMGKLTISMAIFNSCLYVYQRVRLLRCFKPQQSYESLTKNPRILVQPSIAGSTRARRDHVHLPALYLRRCRRDVSGSVYLEVFLRCDDLEACLRVMIYLRWLFG